MHAATGGIALVPCAGPDLRLGDIHWLRGRGHSVGGGRTIEQNLATRVGAVDPHLGSGMHRIDRGLDQQPVAGIIEKLKVRAAGEDRRIHAGAIAIAGKSVLVVPTNVERVAPALGDRQASPEGGTEHRRGVLADAATPFKLGTVSNNGVTLNKSVGSVDVTDSVIEGELIAGSEKDTIEQSHARLDVGNAIGGRAGEVALANREQLINTELIESGLRNRGRHIDGGQSQFTREAGILDRGGDEVEGTGFIETLPGCALTDNLHIAAVPVDTRVLALHLRSSGDSGDLLPNLVSIEIDNQFITSAVRNPIHAHEAGDVIERPCESLIPGVEDYRANEEGRDLLLGSLDGAIIQAGLKLAGA